MCAGSPRPRSALHDRRSRAAPRPWALTTPAETVASKPYVDCHVLAHDQLADPRHALGRQAERRQRGRLRAQQRQIRGRIGRNDGGGDPLAVNQPDLRNRVRTMHHVLFQLWVAIQVADDDARARPGRPTMASWRCRPTWRTDDRRTGLIDRADDGARVGIERQDVGVVVVGQAGCTHGQRAGADALLFQEGDLFPAAVCAPSQFRDRLRLVRRGGFIPRDLLRPLADAYAIEETSMRKLTVMAVVALRYC